MGLPLYDLHVSTVALAYPGEKLLDHTNDPKVEKPNGMKSNS